MLTLLFCTALFFPVRGQHLNIKSGTHVNMTGGAMVVQANLTNDGTFRQNGEVTFSGDETRTLDGSSLITFDSLTIDLAGELFQLQTGALVGANLHLASGQVQLNNSALEILVGAKIQQQNEETYIRTNGSGLLYRPIDQSDMVFFPVGGSIMAPVSIMGTTEGPSVIGLGVRDVVRVNGTNGPIIDEYLVDHTWTISDRDDAGQPYGATFQWSLSSELNTNGGELFLSNYNGGWQPYADANDAVDPGSGRRTMNKEQITDYGLFSVFGQRNGYGVPFDCQEVDLTVPPEEITGYVNYHAEESLESATHISEQSSVYFSAGESIRLLPGFTVERGAYFHAQIFSCSFSNVRMLEDEEVAQLAEPEMGRERSDLELMVFPNPLHDVSTVRFYLPEAGSTRIQVLDLNGQVLSRQDYLQLDAGWQETQFHAGNLPSGLYMLLLETETGQAWKKLIIERG